MPQIPTIPPTLDTPNSTGIPLRTQRPVSIGSPEASQDVGAVLGRSLQGVGQDALRASEALQQTAEVAAHSRRAQDTLDQKSRYYDVSPRLDALSEELKQGEYQTYPEELLKQGTALIDEFATGLSPNAAAEYKITARHKLDILHQKALHHQTERRDLNTQMTLSQGLQEHVTGMLNATDDAEREFHRTQLVDLYGQAVTAQLIAPGAAAEGLQKAKNAVEVGDWQRRAQLNWAGTLKELTEQAEAGRTHIGGTAIADLMQYTEQQGAQQQQTQRQQDAAFQRQLETQKKQLAAQLRGQIVTLDLKPENTGKFRAMLTQVNALVAKEMIRPEDVDGLQTTLRSAINKTLEPEAVQDDPETERRLALDIALARNPTQLDTAFNTVAQEWSKLRAETGSAMMAKIEDRRRNMGILNDSLFREGQDIIVRALLPPGMKIAMVADMLKQEEQQVLRMALDSYEARMFEIGNTDVNQMRRQARDIAHEVRNAFFPAGRNPLGQTVMPKELRDAETEADMYRVLGQWRKDKVPESTLLELEKARKSMGWGTPESGDVTKDAVKKKK